MKRLNTDAVTADVGLVLQHKHLDFLQDNTKELADSIIKGLINYTTGNVVILYGCVLTGTDPGARTMTAGAIYYNGVIYQVPSAAFSTTGAQIPLWTLVNSQDASDPSLFTDGVSRNVQNIGQFVLVAGPVGGSGVSGYVADYNSSVVRYFNESQYEISTGDFVVSLLTNNCTGSITSQLYTLEKQGNTITVQITLTVDIATVGGGNRYYNLKITPIARHKAKASHRRLISIVKSASNTFDPSGLINFNSDGSGDISSDYDNTYIAAVETRQMVITLIYSI